MSIKVLLSDSALMRSVQTLKEDPNLELVGEAASFAETLQLTAALKPDILVLDLHMPDESEYSPQVVKSHVLQNTDCILAISVCNDEDAKALADSLGPWALLDKANLYSELISSIKLFCSSNGSDTAAEGFASANG